MGRACKLPAGSTRYASRAGRAYPHPDGLRVAWLLEPRAAEHRSGTPLKARVLIHNSGNIPVVFRTRSWHQLSQKATDAKGADIRTESTRWTTRGLLLWYQLASGEFIEVHGPGIGVGPVGNQEDWQDTRVGTWLEAKAGDEVTVTIAPLPLMDWDDEKQLQLDGEMPFWRDQIVARLSPPAVPRRCRCATAPAPPRGRKDASTKDASTSHLDKQDASTRHLDKDI